MNILIRTAGGNSPKMELGLGHIFRTINLAKQFKDHNIIFLIEDFGGVEKILKEYKFKKIICIKNKIPLIEDLKNTLKIIKKQKIDLLIVDHFHLKKKYSSELRKFVKMVVITDLKNIQFSADLIINGFVGYENSIRKNQFGTKCCVGPKYQILNEKFSKFSIKKKENKIITTFGGIDEKGISKIMYHEFRKFDTNMKFKMILGPAAKKSKAFQKNTKSKEKIIQIKIKTNDMKKEIESTIFGFCAGGITTYEFASQNIPFAIICDDLHQLKTAKEWEKKKIAINLGMISNNTKIKVRGILTKIQKNEINLKNGRKVIDGKGSIRAKSEILKII